MFMTSLYRYAARSLSASSRIVLRAPRAQPAVRLFSSGISGQHSGCGPLCRALGHNHGTQAGENGKGRVGQTALLHSENDGTGLENIMKNNRAWANEMLAGDKDFFNRLVNVQSPEYLWIGCSDSRVPANQIVGLVAGEVFVHRNVANQIVHTDLNALSVIQYAVEVLKIKHILVVGHYGFACMRSLLFGLHKVSISIGITVAYRGQQFGLIDNWLRHVVDLKERHASQLMQYSKEEEAIDRLIELNVIEQVYNVGKSLIVRDAWKRKQPVTIHGLVYRLTDGLLKDLHVRAGSSEELQMAYQAAIRSPTLDPNSVVCS